jgi:hypothetical protein
VQLNCHRKSACFSATNVYSCDQSCDDLLPSRATGPSGEYRSCEKSKPRLILWIFVSLRQEPYCGCPLFSLNMFLTALRTYCPVGSRTRGDHGLVQVAAAFDPHDRPSLLRWQCEFWYLKTESLVCARVLWLLEMKHRSEKFLRSYAFCCISGLSNCGHRYTLATAHPSREGESQRPAQVTSEHTTRREYRISTPSNHDSKRMADKVSARFPSSGIQDEHSNWVTS